MARKHGVWLVKWRRASVCYNMFEMYYYVFPVEWLPSASNSAINSLISSHNCPMFADQNNFSQTLLSQFNGPFSKAQGLQRGQPKDKGSQIKKQATEGGEIPFSGEQVRQLRASLRTGGNACEFFEIEKSEGARKRHRKDKDPDFKPKNKKITKKPVQNPSRNKNSNIFRAFLKLLLCPDYNLFLSHEISVISSCHGFTLTLSEFLEFVEATAPKTTNYINKMQFKKLYMGDSQHNKTFRMLFHRFTRKVGHEAILEIAIKQKLKPESVDAFLQGLREVEDDLTSWKA